MPSSDANGEAGSRCVNHDAFQLLQEELKLAMEYSCYVECDSTVVTHLRKQDGRPTVRINNCRAMVGDGGGECGLLRKKGSSSFRLPSSLLFPSVVCV
ncbi:MAG: hypothetical protein BJ554DRAFT_3184 [Olpidium bornovanus]|uniref:Uncharacterized protein n=1 Tax=Olpidium bornovanus TaxID=278681 RepID=A0A8H7ZPL1_9FUNG|nr:MAG: hypothetical protein BJ554DRAFT_3184 [Olpidium bornovanus]